ncbi:MAG: GMC oxidoreductase [Thermomicrobiales bacterium]
MTSFDIVIIGTGAGGGTLARSLAGSGAKTLILERGEYLPREPQNWSPHAVFVENRYKTAEQWEDQKARPFRPGVHYWVGGNTKVYGAVLHRLRAEDFDAIEHEGGTSPGWPMSYDDLEPYYRVAEEWYWAHGASGADPTEPWRSSPYPYPSIPFDPYMTELSENMRLLGLNPYPLPLGLDYQHDGRCVRCRTCDAFPCQVDAKADSHICGILPALKDPNISLWTGSKARRLIASGDGGRVEWIEVERRGETLKIGADIVVLAAGAVNSAALLRASTPEGLANTSGQVGSNYMAHNNSVLVAMHPMKLNDTVVQKTVGINDFYFRGPGFPWPMGNLQPVGKVQPAMLRSDLKGVPESLLGQVAARSTDWWVMSEDLPDPDNRVTLTSGGGIRVSWKPTNTVTHRRFVDASKEIFRELGYPLVVTRTMGIETNSHQVGTLRFGLDPATSVLDTWCKAHDIENLYVVDASFFPSSAAVNPALTVMAQAIRVGEHIGGVRHATATTAAVSSAK